jgi:hypothetical protein
MVRAGAFDDTCRRAKALPLPSAHSWSRFRIAKRFARRGPVRPPRCVSKTLRAASMPPSNQTAASIASMASPRTPSLAAPALTWPRRATGAWRRPPSDGLGRRGRRRPCRPGRAGARTSRPHRPRESRASAGRRPAGRGPGRPGTRAAGCRRTAAAASRSAPSPTLAWVRARSSRRRIAELVAEPARPAATASALEFAISREGEEAAGRIFENQLTGFHSEAPGFHENRMISALPIRFSAGTRPTPCDCSTRLSIELSRLSPIMK